MGGSHFRLRGGRGMSTTQAFPLANLVEIDWFDDNDGIVVMPRDKKRFTIQKDRAIDALRLAKDAERFGWQFELLLERLARWVKGHAQAIREAIVTLQDNSLVFVVVQLQTAYDEAFQDDLAELDLSIAQDTDLDLIRLHTVTLPPVDLQSLESFLDKRMVLQYQHGK